LLDSNPTTSLYMPTSPVGERAMQARQLRWDLAFDATDVRARAWERGLDEFCADTFGEDTFDYCNFTSFDHARSLWLHAKRRLTLPENIVFA
jgi:hypothetical protein